MSDSMEDFADYVVTKNKAITEKRYKHQAKFAKDNFQIILDDLEKNKKRMMSSISEEQDYNNAPVFAFANYIKPEDREYTLSYRLFITVTPKGQLTGLEMLEQNRRMYGTATIPKEGLAPGISL